MSQMVRDALSNDLCENGCLGKAEMDNLTDAEIGYYHWLYLEESVLDFM